MNNTVSLISGMNAIGKICLQYERYCEFNLWYEWNINGTVCLISGIMVWMISISFVSSMKHIVWSRVWMILASFVSSMKHTVSLMSGMNDIGKFYLQYQTYCDLWYEWYWQVLSPVWLNTVSLISGMNNIGNFFWGGGWWWWLPPMKIYFSPALKKWDLSCPSVILWFSHSVTFSNESFSSHFSQELWGLEDWNLVHKWTVGRCIVHTGIGLLLLIRLFISSFFFSPIFRH